jgi:hypothetical protein
MSQPGWHDAPEWQRSSARMGVDLHLSGDHGPEASHASWLKQKVDEGWVYGATKDPILKTHPCIMPFDQLPKEQQAKDFIFRAVVQACSGVSPKNFDAEIGRKIASENAVQKIWPPMGYALKETLKG